MSCEQIIYEDEVGERERYPGPFLRDLDLPESLKEALASQYGAEIRLSPPQVWAIENGLLGERGDFLVCAPTNSGKTLIAILRMFAAAVEKGSRSVYVVPLKAIAEEKIAEFRGLAAHMRVHGGPDIQMTITTGDYQLTEDFLSSPPPAEGEIVICTPERLEVMLRNPDYHDWARAIDTYVIDEFHLLGDHSRGGNLECLITRLFCTCPWSSVIGLSATIGGLEQLEKWFDNNDRAMTTHVNAYRFPRLERQVVLTEDKNACVERIACAVQEDPNRSMLIFVYRREDTRRLVKNLRERLSEPEKVHEFHAGLSRDKRLEATERYRNGDVRILVTTTSLKMGVNFPVTDVVLRDVLFYGPGGRTRLGISDVLQMMGRAGRHEIAGRATILCENLDDAHFYRDGLSGNIIEPLDSQLIHLPNRRFSRREMKAEGRNLQSLVLSHLAAVKHARIQEVSDFLNRTYAASLGYLHTSQILDDFDILETEKLVYRIEGSEETYAATKLGRTVSLAGIAPESGALMAVFLRALIRLSERQAEGDGHGPQYLRRLTPLDLLFIALASYECRTNWISSPSKTSIRNFQEYIEALDPEQKPLVNLWRSEASEKFPTRRLLSTLRIPFEEKSGANPEKVFYRILGTAILLHRHSLGTVLAKLSEEYGIEVGKLENDLKFTTIWILSSLSQICDPRKCYKLEFLKMRLLELIENLNFGANLGNLLTLEGVGRKTIQRLVSSGIVKMADIQRIGITGLRDTGVSEVQARRIYSVSMRRSR